MKVEDKEYYFIIYLDHIKEDEKNGEIKFNYEVNKPECIFKKIIDEDKEKIEKMIQVYKFFGNEKNKSFEFCLAGKKYKITFENKAKTFIFDTIIQQKNGNTYYKINQNIGFHEKMNYFKNSLETKKETKQFENLYEDAIKFYSKKLNFEFLINIFFDVYNNTKLCSILLEAFSKSIDKLVQKELINENSEKYIFRIDEICKDTKKLISISSSLKEVDFYGLVLSILNNWFFEKFNEKLNELYQIKKDILFEVLLKYKLLFKKNINLDNDKLNELIKYTINKDYKEFKENALFYLKNIRIFIDIIEANKNEIIKIKNFEPIETIEVGYNEKLDIGEIIKKIDIILNFSKENNKLLIYFKPSFWEISIKSCSDLNYNNIILIYKFNEKLKEYKIILNNMFKDINDKQDKKYKMKKEINLFFKKGSITHQIHHIIHKYIKNNSSEITNDEIIDLIYKYDIYYKDEKQIRKREPEILGIIDLDKISNDFIDKFKAMNFEEIFKEDIDNYLNVILRKLRNIKDFMAILKLVNINNIGEKKKAYLDSLQKKYKNLIQICDLSKDEKIIIKNISNLAFFICSKEDKFDFLENEIKNSNIFNKNIKHNIYLEIINLCKENKYIKLQKFIMDEYLGELNLDNIDIFIEFLQYLNDEDFNNFIENLNDDYIIKKQQFFSSKEELSITLLRKIKENSKSKLKNENKYIIKNLEILNQIFQYIEEQEIKYDDLKTLLNDKKEKVLEKFSVLGLIPDKLTDPEEKYETLMKYYENMNSALNTLLNYKECLTSFNLKEEEIKKLEDKENLIKEKSYNDFNKEKSQITELIDDLKGTIEKINLLKKI